MTITLDGSSLTVEKLVRIAREGEQVELDPAALERIKVCRAMLEEKITAREIMYGTNTGIGEFSEIVLDDDQVQQFQRFLVYNHAAGIGEPAPIEVVRAAMAARANVHAHGNSGNRPEITQTLVALLNAGVTPVMSSKGSVGACGDLAPMAQMALVMMGEGDSFYQGERMTSREALERAGIPIPGLEARDGLATINGSNVLTGMSALLCYDADRWLRQAEIAASMSLEALLANLKPYNSKLHELRGFSGAVRSAAAIRACIQESDLATGKIKTKVQDAYSMRSTPQVIGAAHDAAQVGEEPGGDRAQRRRRQPDLRARGQADADRRQLPGHARSASPWRWSARPSPWSACSASGGSTASRTPPRARACPTSSRPTPASTAA